MGAGPGQLWTNQKLYSRTRLKPLLTIENAGLENAGKSKMQRWKMREWVNRHQTAGLENAREAWTAKILINTSAM